jgi:O-antigen/teichoic acid export membrane protein
MMISLFSFIYVKIDQVMLSFMKGDVVVGWYSAGYQLITVLNVLPLILLTFGYPIFAKLSNKKKELRAFLERLLYYCLVLMLPITVGVMFTAGRVIEFIYGFNTVQSATAFRILIIAEVFVFLTIVMGDFISSCDKQKVFSNITASGAVINLVLNLILIPKYSLYGAAFATLITYLGIFVFSYIYIRRSIIKFSLFRSFIVPLIGSILMGFVVYKLIFLNIILLIAIGGIVYAPVIFAYEYYKYKKSGSFL